MLDPEKNTKIIRFMDSRGSGLKQIDSMILINSAHGQTLEVYQYNNKSYLLLSMNYQNVDNGIWGTEIREHNYS